MDRAEVGDSRTATTSLQCGVEVGSQATLVQNVCERRGSHKLARCGFLGPEIYRNLHDRSVKCIGGLAFSGALVFTEGQSASRQTRSHGFVSNGLTPVDAVDAVVVVSRAPWASERLRSARQGLLY